MEPDFGASSARGFSLAMRPTLVRQPDALERGQDTLFVPRDALGHLLVPVPSADPRPSRPPPGCRDFDFRSAGVRLLVRSNEALRYKADAALVLDMSNLRILLFWD